MNSSSNGFGAASESPHADFHVEYLYGPQWPAVVVLIERAAQLMAEERDRIDAAAREMNAEIAALTGFGSGGLTRLLSNAGRQGGTALEIAVQTAKDYGRLRNVQTAGLVVGQVVSPETDTTDLTTLLQSFGSVGRLAVVRQAATATILQDLVGRGRFVRAVHDELMAPWRAAIGGVN
ncbi:hypothetical protein [Nocardia altamirensis]|uniref:hypothetical protein n=1 Tax=Nocardia altamirensis TaxID=472158 RepID=UPI000A04442B|nr:hypothetical protein [Nocardia altamirensis]